jgi:hypothetical protein
MKVDSTKQARLVRGAFAMSTEMREGRRIGPALRHPVIVN